MFVLRLSVPFTGTNVYVFLFEAVGTKLSKILKNEKTRESKLTFDIVGGEFRDYNNQVSYFRQ